MYTLTAGLLSAGENSRITAIASRKLLTPFLAEVTSHLESDAGHQNPPRLLDRISRHPPIFCRRSYQFSGIIRCSRYQLWQKATSRRRRCKSTPSFRLIACSRSSNALRNAFAVEYLPGGLVKRPERPSCGIPGRVLREGRSDGLLFA